MKKKITLLLFLTIFSMARSFGAKSFEIPQFNSYWQNVYNVVAGNKNVMKMIEMREKKMEDYRKRVLQDRIQDKELFKYNIRVYCLSRMMLFYDKFYSDSVVAIPTPESLQWTSDLHKSFDRYMSDQENLNYLFKSCINLEEQKWPVDFFMDTVAQYPDGEESAKKYLLSKLNIPLYLTDKVMSVSFVIDENGTVATSTVDPETERYFSKQEIITALTSMPSWRPATLMDGSHVKSVVNWKIRIKRMEFIDGQDAVYTLFNNLICPAGLYSNTLRELQIFIDEKGRVINPVKVIDGKMREYDCYLDSVPKWHSEYHQEGDSACMIIPIVKLGDLGMKPVYDAECSFKDDLLQLVRNTPELNGKKIDLSFILDADGRVGKIVSMKVDAMRMVAGMNRDGILLEKVTSWLNGLPKWKYPAILSAGVAKASIVNIKFQIEQGMALLMKSDDMVLYTIGVEAEEEEEIYQVVENMPQYPGGTAKLMKFLQENIKYPSVCQENGIQGRVNVQFVINKDGTIVDPVVQRSVDPYLDAEAIRVIMAMPKWEPGTQRGKPVRVKFTLPVIFRLK